MDISATTILVGHPQVYKIPSKAKITNRFQRTSYDDQYRVETAYNVNNDKTIKPLNDR